MTKQFYQQSLHILSPFFPILNISVLFPFLERPLPCSRYLPDLAATLGSPTYWGSSAGKVTLAWHSTVTLPFSDSGDPSQALTSIINSILGRGGAINHLPNKTKP